MNTAMSNLLDRQEQLEFKRSELISECEKMHENGPGHWTRDMYDREQYINGFVRAINEELMHIEQWKSEIENDVFGTLGRVFG